MTNNGPEKSALPAVPENKEAQPAALDAAQKTEVPVPEQERQEVKLETAQGEEGLHKQTAKERLEQYQPPSADVSSVEQDLDVNKGAMDTISDGMQKAFAMVEKFIRQIQSMGSATLRGMAKTLGMLGFKKPAEWLNEMAGADYAELMTALRKGNLSLAAISPDNPDAKAQTELADGAHNLMAGRYKVLAQTRGPAFTREVYYTEVVAAWKKQGGNGAKTALTPADLQAMAATADSLPSALTGQVAQAPEFVNPLDALAAPMNVMGATPVKVSLRDTTVSMQAGPNGEMVISVAGGAPLRYRLSPKVDGVTGLTWQMRTMFLPKEGLQIDGTASFKTETNATNNVYAPKLIPMTDVRAFLESASKNPDAPYTPTDVLRFERVTV